MTSRSLPGSPLVLADAASRRALIGGGLKLAGATGLAAAAVVTPFGRPIRSAFAQEATPEPGAPDAFGGVELDPQMKEVIDAFVAFGNPPLNTVDPQVARNLASFRNAVEVVLTERGGAPLVPVGDVNHVLIPGPAGDIVVRTYRPAEASEDDALPVVVYFHGGGFVIADLNTYDGSCRALANAAGAVVASVAYRQAPENPFPAAVDDAYAVTQYLLENAADIGGDPERVAVAGESAGGNLATVVCLRARDEGAPQPVHQLLVYPVTTFAPEGDADDSINQFGTSVPLDAAGLEFFTANYLPDPSLAADPFASPLNAASFADLPPATIIAAEIDPLVSQGRLYADALEDAGVETTYSLYENVTHEFFGMGQVVDKAQDAVNEAGEALKSAFGDA